MDASPFDRYHVRERQREREGNIMRERRARDYGHNRPSTIGTCTRTFQLHTYESRAINSTMNNSFEISTIIFKKKIQIKHFKWMKINILIKSLDKL